MKKQIETLKSALQRVARVSDWCSSPLTCLPNVAKDMRSCIKEIENVIYELEKQNDQP